jgi:hypothetical protein
MDFIRRGLFAAGTSDSLVNFTLNLARPLFVRRVHAQGLPIIAQGDRIMERHDDYACQIHSRGTAIVWACPKCKHCSKFIRATRPHIDSCGFESHSCRCERCASLLVGIIDPSMANYSSHWKDRVRVRLYQRRGEGSSPRLARQSLRANGL